MKLQIQWQRAAQRPLPQDIFQDESPHKQTAFAQAIRASDGEPRSCKSVRGITVATRSASRLLVVYSGTRPKVCQVRS